VALTLPASRLQGPIRAKFEPRDPEVEKATGGGWSSILPRRGALVPIALLGVFSLLSTKVPALEKFNAPLIQSVAVEQKVDAAGIPFGPETEKEVNVYGIGTIVAYQALSRLGIRRMKKAGAPGQAENLFPPDKSEDDPSTPN
jgi:hypothetical protein